jgi:hypothetical protein
VDGMSVRKHNPTRPSVSYGAKVKWLAGRETQGQRAIAIPGALRAG